MADTPGLAPIPFAEAVAYLARRGKTFTPSDHWTEVWQQCHQTAFTVARSAGYDVLGNIHAAVLRAQAEGRTFHDFKKDLIPILQRAGWWGTKTKTDPLTGEERTVQLGSPRRLQTIYDVNLRTAAAVGEWERAERLGLRYIRYVGILDARIRPLHRAWHGKVLPADHPWWRTHYPPNGWRCRCHGEHLSGDDLRDLGYTVSPDPDDEGATAWRNPRTGEITQVPRGIDPGWDYNPGRVDLPGNAARVALEKIGGLPPGIGAEAFVEQVGALPAAEREPGGLAGRAVRQLVRSGLTAWMETPARPFPLAVIPGADAKLLGADTQVACLSAETLAKQQDHHPELTVDDYALVQDAVERGEKYRQDDKNIAYALNRGGGVVAIVKATKVGDELYVTSVRRLSRDDLKRRRVVDQLKN